VNNAAVCTRGLYNIEARPACAPPAAVDLPVTIRLLDSNRRAVRTKMDPSAPFLLWDNDVVGAARSLPDGVYSLASSINAFDPIRFTQACPRRRNQCPPKGMMMMMMMNMMGCTPSGKGMMR
jgi:hypothetical protein